MGPEDTTSSSSTSSIFGERNVRARYSGQGGFSSNEESIIGNDEGASSRERARASASSRESSSSGGVSSKENAGQEQESKQVPEGACCSRSSVLPTDQDNGSIFYGSPSAGLVSAFDLERDRVAGFCTGTIKDVDALPFDQQVLRDGELSQGHGGRSDISARISTFKERIGDQAFGYWCSIFDHWQCGDGDSNAAIREIGHVPVFRCDRDNKDSKALKEGKEVCEELRDWHQPDRSSVAERISLLSQTATFVDKPSPPEEEIAAARKRAFAKYPKVKHDKERWPEMARVAVMNLKKDASPGFPLGYKFSTNRELLEIMGEKYLVDLVLTRLRVIDETPWEAFETWTPTECVDAFLCDPIRVFVKNEVHSTKKVNEGRMRLIMSVSVVDQLVERVLNAKQNHAEAEFWEVLSSKPGMGLHDDGLLTLESNFKRMRVPTGTDARGYDMGIPQWKLDSDATRRAESAGCFDEHSMWHKRARLLGYAVFVLSSGHLFEQMVRAFQKSGSYNTSSSNSAMRATDAALVTPPEFELGVCAMGDDCVEDTGWIPASVKDPNKYLIERYARVGLDIKEVERLPELGYIEFCAYKFSLDSSFEPVRWHKMLATFLVTWPCESAFEERYRAFLYELRHSSQVPLCDEVIQFVAHKIRERLVGSRNLCN